MYTVLVVLVIALLALNLAIGSLNIDLATVVRAIWMGLCSGNDLGDIDPTSYQVIWQIRLPRALGAAILGGALALAGYLLQTFFDNPIAGPYILGISSGARLAIALVMIVIVGAGGIMTSWQMVLAAFVGSLGAMSLVMLLARRVRSQAMLIVGGVMVGYICSAGTDFLITFADDRSIANLHTWGLGSFSGISWSDLSIMSVLVAIGAIATLCLAKPIGAYLMGEDYARSVGVNIHRFRLELIALSSLLAASVTAFAGPVSFVGIAVPFLAKSLLGSAQPRRVIPACFLGGAAFCLLCDLIARTAFSPVELSLSAVTAVFGVPVVLVIMLRRQKGRR